LSKTISALAGGTGGLHGFRMKHDRCVSSGLSPKLKRAGSGAECSAQSAERITQR
jgi:hypothetical protein